MAILMKGIFSKNTKISKCQMFIKMKILQKMVKYVRYINSVLLIAFKEKWVIKSKDEHADAGSEI